MEENVKQTCTRLCGLHQLPCDAYTDLHNSVLFYYSSVQTEWTLDFTRRQKTFRVKSNTSLVIQPCGVSVTQRNEVAWCQCCGSFLSDTKQVDVMNLCWKSTTNWVYRPKPSQLQNVQPVMAHILILRPEMSVGAPREVISSTIIDPKWASSPQTFHTAGQICIYTDNTSDCLLKKNKKNPNVLLRLIFCFAGCAIFIQFYSLNLLNFNST